MLTQEQLVAYFEHRLPPAERADFERVLAGDQTAQWALADQENIDLALRVLLQKAEARDRVKESIFTVLRGASVEQLTLDVMQETRAGRTAERLPLAGRILRFIGFWLRGKQVIETVPDRAPTWSRGLRGLWAHSWQRLALSAAIAAGSPRVRAVSLVPACPLRRHSRRPIRRGRRPTELAAWRPIPQSSTRSPLLQFAWATASKLATPTRRRSCSRTAPRCAWVSIRLLNCQLPTLNPQLSTPLLLRPPEINLLRGQVWTKVAKLTNAPQYAIHTPVATAIAKGTEFGLKLQHSRATTNVQSATRNPQPGLPVQAVLTVKEGTVDFTNTFGTVQATAMTESTASAGAAPTEPRRLQTLQTVQLATGASWSLVTSPLALPDVAERLVGGGGWAGLVLHDFLPNAPNSVNSGSTSEVRVARVFQNSPAGRAGIVSGEAVLTLEGRVVTNAAQAERVLLANPEATVSLKLRGSEGGREVALTLTNRPSLVPGPALAPADRIRLATFTREMIKKDAVFLANAENSEKSGAGSSRATVLSGAKELQAAAQNNLGVILESEDALGPAIRAYGHAGTSIRKFPSTTSTSAWRCGRSEASSGKGFGEVAQCGVHAGDECLLSRRLEEIREPDPGDELGDDRQVARRAPFGRAGSGEPWVLEHREALDPLADRASNAASSRPDVQPLEHRAGFPVEAQLPSPQAIGVAGRRDRNDRFEIRCRHCRRANDFATRAPADQFRRTRGNSVIPDTGARG